MACLHLNGFFASRFVRLIFKKKIVTPLRYSFIIAKANKVRGLGSPEDVHSGSPGYCVREIYSAYSSDGP